ncbi:Latent nuclear antigen [Neofusicoccum parvum]|nr:Latent nuclear antigen [Neofusicoccum parvum]
MALKSYWKSIPRLWVPKRWSNEVTTENSLPTKLLVALADLARHGAFNQMRLRAHQTINHLLGKKSSDESQVSKPPTLDGLVPFAVEAEQEFIRLWPPDASAGLTGFDFIPKSHAVEQFGAWPQRDLYDQAYADTLVLEAYQNALNNRGSAFGDILYGPTISTKTIIDRIRDWNKYNRPAGKLWRVPDRNTITGYGAGERAIKEKRDYFFKLELCFEVPMAKIMLMDELRPEDAYYIPAGILKRLAQIVTRFPNINLKTLHHYLLAEKHHADGDRQYYNLSQKDVQKVISKLQNLQDEGKPINPGEEMLPPNLERALFGSPRIAYRHLKYKAPPVNYPGTKVNNRQT